MSMMPVMSMMSVMSVMSVMPVMSMVSVMSMMSPTPTPHSYRSNKKQQHCQKIVFPAW